MMRGVFPLFVGVALWAAALPGQAAAVDLGGSGGSSLLPVDECGGGAEPCASPDAPNGGAALLRPGAPAPAVVLTDPEGGPVALPAGQGEANLFVFWSLFCPPCREEMPLFADLAVRYPSPVLRVVAVNLDGPSLARAVAQYAAQQRLPFPVAMDEKRGERFLAAGLYGVTGTPSLVLVGRSGKVVWSHSGRVDPLELESAILEGLP